VCIDEVTVRVAPSTARNNVLGFCPLQASEKQGDEESGTNHCVKDPTLDGIIEAILVGGFMAVICGYIQRPRRHSACSELSNLGHGGEKN